MTLIDHAPRCPICEDYLTTATRFVGQRCLDPAHWQAAGLLSSHDYCAMAKIAAASFELIKGESNDAHQGKSDLQIGRYDWHNYLRLVIADPASKEA